MGLIDFYHQRRVLNAMVTGDWNKADQYLDKMIKRNPGSFGLIYNKGVVLLAQKKFPDAEKILLDGISNFDKNLRYSRLLGDLYYYWGKREKAFYWYTDAIQQEPSEQEKKLLARRLRITGSKTAYQFIPENILRIEQARAIMKKSPLESLNLYLEAVKIDPSDIESLNNIGDIYLNECNQPGKAVEYFKEALSLAENQAVRNNLRKAENKSPKL